MLGLALDRPEFKRERNHRLTTRGRLSRLGNDGAVAQLGERYVRNVEVRDSIPLGSTMAIVWAAEWNF